MADFKLLYWSVPFRGQFVRATLAFAGKSWEETADEDIGAVMEGPVESMPIPFMGPPVLIDNRTGFAISQMPAIVFYLGDTLGLLPATPEDRALTMKIVNDANDVIDELTLDGGREMWSEERWHDLSPRFRKWASFWEIIGTRHGLTPTEGYLLGGDSPGLADIITATHWNTIAQRFSKLEQLLSETAPKTLALSRRIAALPSMAELERKTWRDYGKDYAGGQIGQSMVKVLGS